MFRLWRRCPRVTYYRRPKKHRDWSTLPYRLLRLYKAALIGIPLLAALYVVLLYGTPHLLLKQYYGQCTYLGFMGEVTLYVKGCPWIAML